MTKYPWERTQYAVGNADAATDERFAKILQNSFVETCRELQKDADGMFPGERESGIPDFLKRTLNP